MVVKKQNRVISCAILEPRYPYRVYARVPAQGYPLSLPRRSGGRVFRMGVSTVIKDYGTEILNAIRENNLQKFRTIVEKQLRYDAKIAKLCVSDIKHRPTKKFACPLILAARQEDPRILHYMMQKGVDPNYVHHTIFSSKRRETVTALHIAVDLSYYDTVEVLLNANADCNIADQNQETPLHIAVKKCDRIMTRMLLSKGANPAIPDRRGNAPLHMATLYGHLQIVRHLLKYNADVYQEGQWGAIAPHIAAREGHIHLVQLFCALNVGNINIKIPCYQDKREKAPIHLAAENGNVETVLALLDQFEAEVNLRDSDGNTPLHCVVLNPFDPYRMRDKQYFTQTARVLIKYRVSINEKNLFGDAALHLAAMNHFQKIVELLLEVGANPFIENDEHLKPIDLVPDDDPVTKQMLKSAMINPRPPVSMSGSFDTLQKESLDVTLQQIQQQQQQQQQQQPQLQPMVTSTSGMPETALEPSNMSVRSTSSMSLGSVFETQRVARELQNQPQMQQHEKEMKRKPHETFHGERGKENEIAMYSEVNRKESKKPPKMSTMSDTSILRKPPPGRKSHRTIANEEDEEEEEPLRSVSMYSEDSSFYTQDRDSKQSSQLGDSFEWDEASSYTNEMQPKHRKEKKQKTGSRQDPKAPADPYRDDGVIYENLAFHRARQKSNSNDPQGMELSPYKGKPQEVAEQQEQDINVRTIPGKPGAIEVEYSGGPITISVDPAEYGLGGQAATPQKPGQGNDAASTGGTMPQFPNQLQFQGLGQFPMTSTGQFTMNSAGQFPMGATGQFPMASTATGLPFLQQPLFPGQPLPGQPGYLGQPLDSQMFGQNIGMMGPYSNLGQFGQGATITELTQSMEHMAPLSNFTPNLYGTGTDQFMSMDPNQFTATPKDSTPVQLPTDDVQAGHQQQKEAEPLQDVSGIINGTLDMEIDPEQSAVLLDKTQEEEQGEEVQQVIMQKVVEITETTATEQQKTKEKRNKAKKTKRKAGHATEADDKDAMVQYTIPELPQEPPPAKKPQKSRPALQPPKPVNVTRLDDGLGQRQDEDDDEISPDNSPNETPEYKSFSQAMAFAKALESKGGAGGAPPSNKPPPVAPKPSHQQTAPTRDVTSSYAASAGLSTDDQRTPGDEEGEETSSSEESWTASSEEEDQEMVTEQEQKLQDPSRHSPPASDVLSVTVTEQTRTEKAATQSTEPLSKADMQTYDAEPRSRRPQANGVESKMSPVMLRAGQRSPSADSNRSHSPADSEGIRRGLNMRVTGEVPKAYKRSQKDSARTAFMKAAPVGIESSSEASDTELGSRTSLTEYSPEQTSSYSVTSDFPASSQPEDLIWKDGKKVKLIGYHAKPYKTFGKIDVKTDALEEALMDIPVIPEEQLSEGSNGSQEKGSGAKVVTRTTTHGQVVEVLRQMETGEHNESINSDDYLENSFEEDLHQYGEEPQTYKGEKIIGQPTALATIMAADSPRESPTGSPKTEAKFAKRGDALAKTAVQTEEESGKLQEMMVAELAAAKKITKEKKEKKKRKKAKKATEGDVEAGQAPLDESLDDMIEQYGDGLEEYEMEPGARRPRPMAKDFQQAATEQQQPEKEEQSEDALSVDLSMEAAEGLQKEKRKKKKMTKEVQQGASEQHQGELGEQSEDALSIDISMEAEEGSKKNKKKKKKKRKPTEDAHRTEEDYQQREVGELSEDALSVDISMELEEASHEKRKKKKKTKKAQAADDVLEPRETNLDESQEQLGDLYNDLEDYELEPGATRPRGVHQPPQMPPAQQGMDEQNEDTISMDKMSVEDEEVAQISAAAEQKSKKKTKKSKKRKAGAAAATEQEQGREYDQMADMQALLQQRHLQEQQQAMAAQQHPVHGGFAVTIVGGAEITTSEGQRFVLPANVDEPVQALPADSQHKGGHEGGLLKFPSKRKKKSKKKEQEAVDQQPELTSNNQPPGASLALHRPGESQMNVEAEDESYLRQAKQPSITLPKAGYDYAEDDDMEAMEAEGPPVMGFHPAAKPPKTRPPKHRNASRGADNAPAAAHDDEYPPNVGGRDADVTAQLWAEQQREEEQQQEQPTGSKPAISLARPGEGATDTFEESKPYKRRGKIPAVSLPKLSQNDYQEREDEFAESHEAGEAPVMGFHRPEKPPKPPKQKKPKPQHKFEEEHAQSVPDKDDSATSEEQLQLQQERQQEQEQLKWKQEQQMPSGPRPAVAIARPGKSFEEGAGDAKSYKKGKLPTVAIPKGSQGDYDYDEEIEQPLDPGGAPVMGFHKPTKPPKPPKQKMPKHHQVGVGAESSEEGIHDNIQMPDVQAEDASAVAQPQAQQQNKPEHHSGPRPAVAIARPGEGGVEASQLEPYKHQGKVPAIAMPKPLQGDYEDEEELEAAQEPGSAPVMGFHKPVKPPKPPKARKPKAHGPDREEVIAAMAAPGEASAPDVKEDADLAAQLWAEEHQLKQEQKQQKKGKLQPTGPAPTVAIARPGQGQVQDGDDDTRPYKYKGGVPAVALPRPSQGDYGEEQELEYAQEVSGAPVMGFHKPPPQAKKPVHAAMETNIDAELQSAQPTDTNIDADLENPTGQGILRQQAGRKSRRSKKGARRPVPASENAAEPAKDEFQDQPPTTSLEGAAMTTVTANLQHHRNTSPRHATAVKQDNASIAIHRPEDLQLSPGPDDDIHALSRTWKARREQEEEMQRMLRSMRDPNQLEDYEQKGEYQQYEEEMRSDASNLVFQPGSGVPLDGKAAEQYGQQRSQKPRRIRTLGAPQTYEPQSGTWSADQAEEKPETQAAVADMWVRQHGKPEVVEMKPAEGRRPEDNRRRPPHGAARHKKRHSGRSAQGSTSMEAMSDSEAFVRRKRTKKSISFEAGMHSEAEVYDMEAPLPPDPQKTLQEAAMEAISAGLHDQPKVTPRRPLNFDRPINYTRGVYRPHPMQWRGSTRSTSSMGQYDDSQLMAQLWMERNKSMTTESEGEADTEDINQADDSYLESPSQAPQLPGQLMHTPYGLSKQHHSSPENLNDSASPGSQKRVTIMERQAQRPQPKKMKRRRVKPDLPPEIMEPGPQDLNQYGMTAQLWMERVDKKTLEKSKTMYLKVMDEGTDLPREIARNFPQAQREGDPTGDDTFLPPQWVIARGRTIRRRKREIEKQQEQEKQQQPNRTSNISQLSDDVFQSTGRPGSPTRQMLLFFRVGSNWKDLAWILFDGIQTDSETLRMIRDIQLKYPGKLTEQVNNMMHRWWKRKGNEATIEELQRALDMVHLVYICEEGVDPRASVTSYTDTEDDLDMSEISDTDPDVNRLIHRYQVRSLDNSFDLLESEQAGAQRTMSLSSEKRHPGSKGASINRSKVDKPRGSASGSGRLESSHDESLDYESPGDHSFLIVQPQLKSSDYRHETNL